MQVWRHHTLTGDTRISIPSDMEYREEAHELFHEKSKKTCQQTRLLFGSGRHLSQNKIWPQKFFFIHVLQSLEDRCSNKYSLFKLTGNEDNYFPLRSGMQCRLSADLTDCGSGNCWAWPHLIWAAVSLLKWGRIYWRLGLPGNNTHLIIWWTLLKEKTARIFPPRWCTRGAKFTRSIELCLTLLPNPDQQKIKPANNSTAEMLENPVKFLVFLKHWAERAGFNSNHLPIGKFALHDS